MKTFFIKEKGFQPFVEKLLSNYEIIGPKEKETRFTFEVIKNYKDLRLDYDTTILPPKKVFFPPKQDIVHFDQSGARGCIDPKERILFGVHPYDIVAIKQLDKLFKDGKTDYNYLANREATIIIGTNIQNTFKESFYGSIGSGIVSDGFDIFITKINNGYVAQVASEKGENIIKDADTEKASNEQIKEMEKVNKDILEKCTYKFEMNNSLPEKIRESFKNKLWKELSEKCFSCGSCNLVCPTCYCFDVQDMWNLDLSSGKRERIWDGCLVNDFSTVTVQGGNENFREHKEERYRHRVMRKLSYLNTKLNAPACVGCGRCSAACTADIANPVKIIKRIVIGQISEFIVSK